MLFAIRDIAIAVATVAVAFLLVWNTIVFWRTYTENKKFLDRMDIVYYDLFRFIAGMTCVMSVSNIILVANYCITLYKTKEMRQSIEWLMLMLTGVDEECNEEEYSTDEPVTAEQLAYRFVLRKKNTFAVMLHLATSHISVLSMAAWSFSNQYLSSLKKFGRFMSEQNFRVRKTQCFINLAFLLGILLVMGIVSVGIWFFKASGNLYIVFNKIYLPYFPPANIFYTGRQYMFGMAFIFESCLLFFLWYGRKRKCDISLQAGNLESGPYCKTSKRDVSFYHILLFIQLIRVLLVGAVFFYWKMSSNWLTYRILNEWMQTIMNWTLMSHVTLLMYWKTIRLKEQAYINHGKSSEPT